jgi:hypothetical protein
VLADSSMPIPSREMALKLKLNPALAGKPVAASGVAGKAGPSRPKAR